MNWTSFFTYLAQGAIVLVFLFVVSAAVSAVIDVLRKR